MKRLCSNCRFVDVSNDGKMVCRIFPPRSNMVPEGTKLMYVEPSLDAKRVACKEYEEKA